MATKPPLLFPTSLDLDKQTHCAATTNPLFKVVLDSLATRTSVFTRDKTHYRTMYEYARNQATIQSYQDAKEVLLYNQKFDLMDGSITTPYFCRNGKWITPHTECGGQQGTTRRWAIDQGLCTAGFVSHSSLKPNEIIWLSNGVKGFFTARVIIPNNNMTRSPSANSELSSGGSSGFSLVSSPSSASSDAVSKHQVDEDYEDEFEVRRKHPVAKDADVFRKSAFSLDMFDRATKL